MAFDRQEPGTHRGHPGALPGSGRGLEEGGPTSTGLRVREIDLLQGTGGGGPGNSGHKNSKGEGRLDGSVREASAFGSGYDPGVLGSSPGRAPCWAGSLLLPFPLLLPSLLVLSHSRSLSNK